MAPPRTHVLVGTNDLRAALTAVRSHASTDDTDAPVLGRIRVTVNPDGNLYVAATDRYTAGLAIVSIWEDRTGYGEIVDLDLTPADAADILQVFKPAKGAESHDDRVALLVTTTELVLTDASGLFPDASRSFTLPLLQPSTYPDLPRLMAASVANAESLTRAGAGTSVTGISTTAKMMSRFAAAGTAYSAPIDLIQTAEARAALLVRCGESFIGLLMPLSHGEDEAAALAADLRAWTRRLPEPLPTPVPMPENAADLNGFDEVTP
jgi:hypothetical protein